MGVDVYSVGRYVGEAGGGTGLMVVMVSVQAGVELGWEASGHHHNNITTGVMLMLGPTLQPQYNP